MIDDFKSIVEHLSKDDQNDGSALKVTATSLTEGVENLREVMCNDEILADAARPVFHSEDPWDSLGCQGHRQGQKSCQREQRLTPAAGGGGNAPWFQVSPHATNEARTASASRVLIVMHPFKRPCEMRT